MRNVIVIVATMLCTSCSSMVGLVDYGISEWEKIAPADSYDRTLIDAWQSGIGGKVLATSKVVASAFSSSSNEASQKAENIIDDAINKLNSSEWSHKNDVANWFGAILTMGDAMIAQHRLDQIEEYLQDPEIAMAIESVDYTTGTIKWKDSAQYFSDLKELRESELSNSFNELSIEMTPSEYYSLPKAERQEIDVLILQGPKNEESQPVVIVAQPANEEEQQETVSLYVDKIESSSVGGYKFNSIMLSDTQREELDDIVEYLAADNSILIEIVGHTCSIGSEKGNYNVGLQRADNAKKYLISKGIDANRIKIVSESYNNPKAPNDTPEGRAQNRRVTFRVIKN